MVCVVIDGVVVFFVKKHKDDDGDGDEGYDDGRDGDEEKI